MSEARSRVFRSRFRQDIDLAASYVMRTQDECSAVVNASTVADLGEFLAAARTMRASGFLRPKAAFRMASALQLLGAAQEAHDVLTSVTPPPGWDFAWSFLAAQAALAIGHTREADVALAQARQTACATADRDAVETLASLRDCDLPQSLGSWDEADAWVWRCIDAGQPGLAAGALSESLARLDPGIAEPSAEQILSTARGVLRIGDARVATEVLAGLAGLSALLHGDLARAELMRSCVAQACAAAGLWREAIKRFEIRDEMTGVLSENLTELARCVGEDLLAQRPITLAAPGPRRVFDIFPFNGEFLMLEMKLAEMGEWVERFVLVEAGQTFRGEPKPLYFEENLHRFAEHKDKIIHVRVDRFPSYLATPWAREFFQRDSAAVGLSGLCSASDLVILSDVDEIVRQDVALRVTEPLMGADLRQFHFFLNCEMMEGRAPVRTVFARGDLLARLGASYLRIGSITHRSSVFAREAGWHFSSIGSAQDLVRKRRSYSHVELADMDEARAAELQARIRATGSRGAHAVRELDDSFPHFVLRNRDRLADYLI